MEFQDDVLKEAKSKLADQEDDDDFFDDSHLQRQHRGSADSLRLMLFEGFFSQSQMDTGIGMVAVRCISQTYQMYPHTQYIYTFTTNLY